LVARRQLFCRLIQREGVPRVKPLAAMPHFVLRAAGAETMSDSDCGQHLQPKKFRSRSHNAVIRVYDEAGNVIETHEHVGDFKEP
jgi:hypothetical protein